jgi:hypothetical protein
LLRKDSFDPRSDPDTATHEFQYRMSRFFPRDIKKLVVYLGGKYHVTLGKWMLQFNPDKIDEKWNLLARAMYDGRLSAITAKVATSGHPYGHLICVYTYDYRDLPNVMKIRRELSNLGFKEPLDYKADIYTYLGIYEKNDWGISENMYRK